MPSQVFFHPTGTGEDVRATARAARRVLEALVENERITLGPRIPLKVHFGERGNVTFLRPETYDGIVDLLQERGVESCFMETSALYGGRRFKRELHAETAKLHGFDRLPVVFADGEHGEDFAEVAIDGRHFSSCKVGRAFQEHEQIIVLAHFKGHMLAGFGGAIKQLAMGFASKGGKLAMHMGRKPKLRNRKCKKCGKCKTRCAVDALVIGEKKSYIDHAKCVACGACMAICPSGAITIITLRGVLKFLGFGNPFVEKLVEGAFAAQKGKRNLYVNFATSITRGCDCEPRKMKPVLGDIGVLASTDPVALDKACWDLAAARGKTFRGRKTFAYAERIGLGSADYALHEID